MGAQAKRDTGATSRPAPAQPDQPPAEHVPRGQGDDPLLDGELSDDAPNDDEDSLGATPAYVVAPGRSLQVDTRTLGPGAAAKVSENDVEWLLATGFIVEVGAVADAGGGVSVGGLTILGGRQTGSKVR
jgi:hypothetical protein